jgi:hypothetical protein
MSIALAIGMASGIAPSAHGEVRLEIGCQDVGVLRTIVSSAKSGKYDNNVVSQYALEHFQNESP